MATASLERNSVRREILVRFGGETGLEASRKGGRPVEVNAKTAALLLALADIPQVTQVHTFRQTEGRGVNLAVFFGQTPTITDAMCSMVQQIVQQHVPEVAFYK